VNVRRSQRQSGFALLVFLLLLMGAGGVVLANFSQNMLKEVNTKRYEHNQRVLQQAKQALLMYAYRYPEIASAFNGTERGPGRLPCPDTNQSGTPNPPCTANVIGRFPWRANGMQFYGDARDSSGETLWYAVSENFQNQVNRLNSSSRGTISIFDQNGQLMFDGEGEGVVAVIIAPGAALDGQDRVADPNDPANFLDNFGAFNNASFDNDSNDAADGFILGPVFDSVENTNVINDQVVFITAREVLDMAEKATLKHYRDAINDFRSTPGITRYPWMYDYATDNLFSFNSSRDRVGRIPSIFSSYFTDADSGPINIEITVRAPRRQFYINAEIGSPFHFSRELTTPVLTGLQFSDGGDDGDDEVRLVADPSVADQWMYFYWQLSPNTGWKKCGDSDGDGVLGEVLEDCDRDSFGTLTPGAGNQIDSQVLRVGYSWDFSAGMEFVLDLSDFDRLTDIVYTDAGLGTDALVEATFEADDVDGASEPEFRFEKGVYYTSGVFIAGTGSSDTGSQSATDDSNMNPIVSQSLVNTTFSFTLRYFPSFPLWAHEGADDWHSSIMMAIANGYEPGGGGTCTAGTDCLVVPDIRLTRDPIASLLIIAGNSSFTDNANGTYLDEMNQIFDAEQLNGDTIFLGHRDDDQILLVQTQ